ncbi:MAG TPA: hypothetical protein VGO69_05790 [Pyrinomonadaceae bacterium]|nr:hypothetical protein [Pyrinomonadaceae bacterium]
MARTTKIPCDGAIYTVHSNAYGTVTETDLDAGAEAPPESDESMGEERARYAQVLQELTEFEEMVTQAETRTLLTDNLDDRNTEDSEEIDSSP